MGNLWKVVEVEVWKTSSRVPVMSNWNAAVVLQTGRLNPKVCTSQTVAVSISDTIYPFHTFELLESTVLVDRVGSGYSVGFGCASFRSGLWGPF